MHGGRGCGEALQKSPPREEEWEEGSTRGRGGLPAVRNEKQGHFRRNGEQRRKTRVVACGKGWRSEVPKAIV